jgi:hypothetical protein
MAEARGTIALYFAHVVAETLRPRLSPGASVLDFGDLRGLVAEHLVAAGATVVREEGEAAEALTGRQAARMGGAFAEVGDWSHALIQGKALAPRLAPGAPVLVRLRRGPDQPVARVIADLGPEFFWERPSSLGHFVPEETAWAERYPQAFGFLCALEGALRSRPLFRDAGREALLLGVRREGAC